LLLITREIRKMGGWIILDSLERNISWPGKRREEKEKGRASLKIFGLFFPFFSSCFSYFVLYLFLS
jgi:hypothetical protein